MKLVLLGDIHDKWKTVGKILDHEFPEGGGTVLCVGDLVTYPEIKNNKFYFVYGNHENLEKIGSLGKNTNGLIPIYTGDRITLPDGRTIAGICGNFSPRFYETQEKNKYIKKSEIGKITSLEKIDILLSHEAPFGVGVSKFGKDVGQPIITEVVSRLKPRLAFFGHHHMYFEGKYNGTKIVGLDYPKRSYVVLETYDFSIKKVEATLVGKEYKFDWQ